MRTGRPPVHGMSFSPTYKSWAAMIQRTRNPNATGNKIYYHAGIRVCERWKVFLNFLADMGERPEGMSLDRIDNTKGYTPENCRWADWTTQNRNRTNTRWVEFNGERLPIEAWAKKLGINEVTLRDRFKAGWSIERALTTNPKDWCSGKPRGPRQAA